jgi:GntR family transcriptional regulator / MocR family aminotransferase
MTLHISLVGRPDLVGEIYRQIRQAILDRKLKAGDRLPPTRVLAKSLAVSRSTVTAAYERLVGEGLISSRIGAATFVSYEAGSRSRTSPRPIAPTALHARAVWDTVAVSAAFPEQMPFDFRMGIPEIAQFPHDAWRRAVVRALRSQEMARGMYESSAGLRSLRESIADHIGVSRNVNATADDVIVTNGTQQGLDIVARVLLEPGDVVAVEDPGYGPPRHLFRTLGSRVVGVPVDAEGLVVDGLPSNARVVYVTPSHQFPLGITMSLTRRRALLAWAERYNAAVIEDDYDSEFRFGGRPFEPLQTLDVSGRVIYIGSFSKTVLPALRMGFLVMPSSLRAAAVKAKFVTDWHSSTLVQAALARFMADGGFARHLRKMTGLYRERRDIICETIAKNFVDHLELIPGEAGLHVAAMAKQPSVEAIASVARQATGLGVAFQQLASFAVSAQARAGITIAYGRIPKARISEGLGHLRKCFG